jgi:hypothetical protein
MVLIPVTLLDRILYRGNHCRVLLDQIPRQVRVFFAFVEIHVL